MDLQSQLKLNRWKILSILALVALITIFYIWNVVKINDILAENRRLEKRHSELLNYTKSLQVKVINLQSPSRICEIAEKRLGLVKPDKLPEVIKN